MSEPFIGEIRMFGGTFAPSSWAFCNGQLLAIAQYSALFSILGTTYGGDGRVNFGLPDLRGRVPTGMGTGPGLPPVVEGQMGGAVAASLTIANLPPHSHQAVFTPSGGAPAQVNVTDTVGTLKTAAGNLLAQPPATGPSSALIYAPATSPVSGTLGGVSGSPGSGTVTVGNTGGGLPVSTLPPFLGINFIIALEGIYPPRN
jgi:microcystin-dependent protein